MERHNWAASILRMWIPISPTSSNSQSALDYWSTHGDAWESQMGISPSPLTKNGGWSKPLFYCRNRKTAQCLHYFIPLRNDRDSVRGIYFRGLNECRLSVEVDWDVAEIHRIILDHIRSYITRIIVCNLFNKSHYLVVDGVLGFASCQSAGRSSTWAFNNYPTLLARLWLFMAQVYV